MSTGLLFPGQGSQHVGMGHDVAHRFPAAREVFEEANDILGFDLASLAWEGPPEVLTATENAQPALFTHSIATYRVIEETVDSPGAAAGHSLGELSAHAAAGTYSFADGLRIVRRRGELMAQAGDTAPGTMAAILGLDLESVSSLCEEAAAGGLVVVPANVNADGQIVVSGELSGVAWIAEAAERAGAKRVIELNVSAAFHSPLMGPAAKELEDALTAVPFASPQFPVISNVTADATSDPDQIRNLLVRQLTSPVRWIECVARMRSFGVDSFLEVGAGKVLTGLNKRNAKGLPTTPLSSVEALESFRESP